TIGGSAAGNFIAGNRRFGINISGPGSSGNILQANLVGSNNSSGIQIADGASNNTVGGTSTGLGNVISTNGIHGVLVTGAGVTGNLIQGNFIGTDGSGSTALPNRRDGVVSAGGASGNTAGGTAAGVTNVISGNGRFGVNISGAGTTGNVVAKNVIGTDVTTTAAVPNKSSGIQVAAGADGNTIGGGATGT